MRTGERRHLQRGKPSDVGPMQAEQKGEEISGTNRMVVHPFLGYPLGDWKGKPRSGQQKLWRAIVFGYLNGWPWLCKRAGGTSGQSHSAVANLVKLLMRERGYLLSMGVAMQVQIAGQKDCPL